MAHAKNKTWDIKTHSLDAIVTLSDGVYKFEVTKPDGLDKFEHRGEKYAPKIGDKYDYKSELIEEFLKVKDGNMIKFYGKKGTNKPMPDGYDTNTELEIIRHGFTTATGRWISTYNFLLKKGALILGRDNYEGPGTGEIIDDLIQDGLIEDVKEGDFTLLEDIHLYSTSAAGKLVLGQQSNGHNDWVRKSDGKSINEL
jgi:hypothetical protein